MSKQTPFAVGQKWLCTPKNGRARFYFVIVDRGVGKTSSSDKMCRIEVHPDDLAAKIPGYEHNGMVTTYSHKHIKKYAVLETSAEK